MESPYHLWKKLRRLQKKGQTTLESRLNLSQQGLFGIYSYFNVESSHRSWTYHAPRDKNPDWIVGTNGTKDILTSLSAMDEKVATVLLGDISATNAQRIIYQSKALFKGLDGVAVLSAITEAEDPKKAASELKALLKQPPPFAALSGVGVRKVKDVRALLQIVPTVLKVLRQKVPLCHHVTSVVVQSFSSNVALAM